MGWDGKTVRTSDCAGHGCEDRRKDVIRERERGVTVLFEGLDGSLE